LECTLPLLAEDKPWHLLGFGKIDEIFEVLNRGIDLFASRATPVKYASLSFGPGKIFRTYPSAIRQTNGG